MGCGMWDVKYTVDGTDGWMDGVFCVCVCVALGKKSILKSYAGDGKEVAASECVSYPITVTGAKDKYILRLFGTDPSGIIFLFSFSCLFFFLS